MRRIVVRHELADQPAVHLDRNKRDRVDALMGNGFLEGVRKAGRFNVLKVNRQRISLLSRPRRMTFNRLPVLVGNATRSNKAHNIATIEQENGGALTGERTYNRPQRDIIDLPY